MYVPNYIPEPLEVPGNVALDPYQARVQFIRRVTGMHLTSLGLVTALARLPLHPTGIGWAAASLASLLVALDLLRIGLRGRRAEALISGAALPCVLLLTAWLAAEGFALGIPFWACLAGPMFCGVYTLFCGRDFSFVGCYMLSLVASSTAVAAVCGYAGLGVRPSAWALALNAGYLTYFVYDLASLMARRRFGEEFAAVTDLYRDVFNVFGYVIRVIGHWRRHKIWTATR